MGDDEGAEPYTVYTGAKPRKGDAHRRWTCVQELSRARELCIGSRSYDNLNMSRKRGKAKPCKRVKKSVKACRRVTIWGVQNYVRSSTCRAKSAIRHVRQAGYNSGTREGFFGGADAEGAL